MNHAVASRSPEAVLALQRAAGNATVARLAEREQHVHDAACGHGTPVQRLATVVQRAPTAAPPRELALMPGAVRREMGGADGFVKYTMASTGVDPAPLYRAMGKEEFDGLMDHNALPQGRSYQGFSPKRSYSEAYVTGSAKNPTSHLVEFYRPSLTTEDGDGIEDVYTVLKSAGAGEKAENGILSIAVGDTATYSLEVLQETRKREELERLVNKLNGEIAGAEADLADENKRKFHKARQKTLAAKKAELARLMAPPKGPKPPPAAKGDAVKALNKALAKGDLAWRLVTFRSTV
jgi:hypothetical protein